MAFHPRTMTVAQGGTSVTSITAHNLIVGNGASTPNLLAPSATSGIPLVSNGASADPSYTTAVVAGGGTGVTSNTAYAVLCGGITSTDPIQSIASVGTAGQVLTSNGAAALPTFQTVSTPSATGFIAYASATLSAKTGDGTLYQVIYNSTVRNDSTIYATGTGLVTVNKTGLWYFNVNMAFSGVVVANTYGQFFFQTGAGAQWGYTLFQGFQLAENGSLYLTGSAIIPLTSGNTLAVYTGFGGNASKNISLQGSASPLTSFSGYFIGA